jgi:hypothetical protein
MPQQFSIEDLKNYFIRDKNWYYLLGELSECFSTRPWGGELNRASEMAWDK